MADKLRLLTNEKPSAALKFISDKEGGVNEKNILKRSSTHFIRQQVNDFKRLACGQMGF